MVSEISPLLSTTLNTSLVFTLLLPDPLISEQQVTRVLCSSIHQCIYAYSQSTATSGSEGMVPLFRASDAVLARRWSLSPRPWCSSIRCPSSPAWESDAPVTLSTRGMAPGSTGSSSFAARLVCVFCGKELSDKDYMISHIDTWMKTEDREQTKKSLASPTVFMSEAAMARWSATWTSVLRMRTMLKRKTKSALTVVRSSSVRMM